MKKIVSLFILIFIFSLIVAVPASAQSPNPTPSDDEVNAIARDLYCPVCENTPLDVCPTQACIQWRDLIRLKLSEGETPEQIKQYFIENYGARVLSTPPLQGFYALIYIVPPVILAFGVFFFYRAFRGMLKPPAQIDENDSLAASTAPSADQAPVDDYMRRVEEELKKQN